MQKYDPTPLEQKKNSDAAYAGAVASATSVIDGIRQFGDTSQTAIQSLFDEVMELYMRHDKALLLENLLVSRLNQQYYPHHAVNVALLNGMIADSYGLSMRQIERLVRVGLVIDFGMMQLPVALTEANRVYTEEERVLVRKHAEMGVALLRDAGETDEVLLDAVRLHHERANGTGYPHGLGGEGIPLEARITAVADSFDAATARKPYRAQKSPFQMLAEFSENTDGALDPEIIRVTVRYLASLLVGRQVILADHSIGTVVHVDFNDLAYPLVRVVGRLVQTSPELPTTKMNSYLKIY